MFADPPAFSGLPDFRNRGVWLRLLVGANLSMLVVALVGNRALDQLPGEIAELAALVEPMLLLVLALLYIVAPLLKRLPLRLALPAVVLSAVLSMLAVEFALAQLIGRPPGWRSSLAAGLGAILLLGWLRRRDRALEPALAEARLAALTARIRPHFFFNSLNAVLGIMRDDPRRAERALEELGELFRALMRDNRALAPLAEEIALARTYLDIEKLRLGERLQVDWDLAACPPDTLSLPLLLQPLLENAVYHGIEPAAEPGAIRVRIAATADGVRIEIDNPLCADAAEPRAGNHMALANLRERLMLYYDLEARLDCTVRDGRYCVRVDLPHRSAA